MARTADKATRIVRKKGKEDAGSETKGNAAPPSKNTKASKALPKQKVANSKSTKTALVLSLLKRKGGVTSAELMDVTGWRAHSVRGFLSGAVRKRLGLTVVSTKNEGGSPTYSIEA